MDCKFGSWSVSGQSPLDSKLTMITGITPFVNPDDLKFFFQEIRRLASNGDA